MRNIATALALLLALLIASASAQDVDNPQTNASALTSGTVAAARGGAGTINGALKGNGSGTVSQAACADLSNGAGGCSASLPLSAANGGWGSVGAWGTTTPTPTCNSGSGTWTGTVINFITINKTTFISVNLVLSAAGTCAGQISVTIPVTALAGSGATCVIRENAISGLGYQGWVSPGSNTLNIATMAAGGPTLATGDVFIGSLVVQNQ
jgi:hypothetical protein